MIKLASVESAINMPLIVITPERPWAKILSLGDLGGLFIISGSPGSSPNAIAGKPSVARFTINI